MKKTTVNETSLNLIVENTEIEGNIKTASSFRVDGKLKGIIECQGSFVLGANGVVEGEVRAQEAIIGGKVIGTLKVKNKLRLEPKSYVSGEIKCSRLIIDEGAVFDGKSLMKNDDLKASINAEKK